MTARAWGVILLLVVVVGAGSALWFRCEGAAPDIEAPKHILVGAPGTRVQITVSDTGSGLRHLVVRARQGQRTSTLVEQSQPGTVLAGGARPRLPVQLRIPIDPKALGLAEGSAVLEVEAEDWSWAHWLRGNTAHLEIPVTVDLTPPRISVVTGLTYVERGGAAAVAYHVGESTSRDGVLVGRQFFRGYPAPRSHDPHDRVALFAVARNDPPGVPIAVVAEDEARNRATASWPVHIQERTFDQVPIHLSHAFMVGKVKELADHLGVDDSNLVKAFQIINSRVRATDEQRIHSLVTAPGGETRPLWHGAFLQMRNSKVTSRFAEHRTYDLGGQVISQAIHYGYDLASTTHAPIRASNAGRVIFAGDMGIYGNCILIDHGLGVTTLYGHLSQMDVKKGDVVSKDQQIGISDSTGLAGGDHLHFAVLVGGVYVDPKEFWDPRWMRDHVEAVLNTGS